MKSLEEFDKTVETFGNEVSNLKTIREAYQKVLELTNEYLHIVEQIEKATQSISSAEKAVSQIVTETRESINDHGKLVSKKQDEIKSTIANELTSIKKLIEQNAEEDKDATRKFYKDIIDTLQIRLDTNKGELRQLIEHERSEIKSMLDNQSTALERDQNDHIQKLEKQIKVTRNTCLAFGLGIVAICLTLIILVLIQ